MKARSLILVATCIASACVPDLNTKASRVVAPRVVAVRATPAEVSPGDSVSWTAIVVTPLENSVQPQIDWTMCLKPRSPSDSITVDNACFGSPDQLSADGGPSPVVSVAPAGGAFVQGTIPFDACRQVGPEAIVVGPHGVQRPPDPDITGGYQLPLRLVTSESGTISDITFDRQRLHCNLANAPSDIARTYGTQYKLNQNPDLNAMELAGKGALADGSAKFNVPRGAKIPMRVGWAPSSQETYLLFDPIARQLETRSENLEISWYTNGGQFEHDRTTPDRDTPNVSSNVIELDETVTQSITIWVLIRDDRGGAGVSTMTLFPQ